MTLIQSLCAPHGPLTKCVKLRVVHAPGMPGTFSPPPTSKETASQGPWHASRHVRHARVVMHVRMANQRWQEKRSRHSRHMRNPQFYVSGKGLIPIITYKCSCSCYTNSTCSPNHKNGISSSVNKDRWRHGAHGHFAGFDKVGGGGWETEVLGGSRGGIVQHFVVKHNSSALSAAHGAKTTRGCQGKGLLRI